MVQIKRLGVFIVFGAAVFIAPAVSVPVPSPGPPKPDYMPLHVGRPSGYVGPVSVRVQ